jgi:hypothetical protein
MMGVVLAAAPIMPVMQALLSASGRGTILR